jgi:hypothetical protein
VVVVGAHPELASMIEQAFKEESETLSRRFKKVAV